MAEELLDDLRRKAEKLIVLDVDQEELKEARWLIETLGPRVDTICLGPTLLAADGRQAMYETMSSGAATLLCDARLHDTPQRVLRTARAYARQGASFTTAHIGGGIPMLEAAMTGAQEGSPVAHILGIPVLPSTDGRTLLQVSLAHTNVRELMLHRAAIARQIGLAGIFGRADLTDDLRSTIGIDLQLMVTNTIFGQPDDRTRPAKIGTVRSVIEDGANLIFIDGQVLIDSPDPMAKFEALRDEIMVAMARSIPVGKETIR